MHPDPWYQSAHYQIGLETYLDHPQPYLEFLGLLTPLCKTLIWFLQLAIPAIQSTVFNL